MSGAGATRTVTVNVGTGTGTIRLDVIDDDTIIDSDQTPLGGPGAGNGNFTAGEAYSIVAGGNAPTLDLLSLLLLVLLLAGAGLFVMKR